MTAADISALRWSLEEIYQEWHLQQLTDERFFNLEYEVMATDIPSGYDQVRPPTAARLVNTAANHTAGNIPKLHVPRRAEVPSAQERATLMEKAGQGFWYRAIATSALNPLRAWAQDAYLKGAIGAALLYDSDAYPEDPTDAEYEGMDAEERRTKKREIDGLRRSAWPFRLLPIDPSTMYPDPETEGQTYIIIAFNRRAYDVKRQWPQWDYWIPSTGGQHRDVAGRFARSGAPGYVKPTDWVQFLAYFDRTHKGYFVGGTGPNANIVSLQWVGQKRVDLVEHGYGFLPYFFAWSGLGQPHGLPRQKGTGLITKVRDLIELEARRRTHLDAIIAQNAFPPIAMAESINANMALGGVIRFPDTVDVREKIAFFRPNVPVQELVLELRETKSEIESATVPDALGGQPTPTVYSGFQNLQILGAGRSNLRPVVDAIERCVEWATAGFFRLVENKCPGPVSIWGKGMAAEDEFVTIRSDDIRGHYEVYATLEPSLPHDTSRDIADGLKLYEHGGLPMRDVLESYARRENADELLRERLAEDLAKDPAAFKLMVAEVLKLYGVVPPSGPIAAPGFAAGQIRANGAPGAPGAPGNGSIPASMPPERVAPATQIPTPPVQPGSVAQANLIAQQSAGGPTPR